MRPGHHSVLLCTFRSGLIDHIALTANAIVPVSSPRMNHSAHPACLSISTTSIIHDSSYGRGCIGADRVGAATGGTCSISIVYADGIDVGSSAIVRLRRASRQKHFLRRSFALHNGTPLCLHVQTDADSCHPTHQHIGYTVLWSNLMQIELGIICMRLSGVHSLALFLIGPKLTRAFNQHAALDKTRGAKDE